MATNASLGPDAQPTKDDRPTRGRDGRETAQTDGSNESTNNPPNHGVPTHGPGRFLWEVPPGTPIEELGDLYQRWTDDTEQADLEQWGGSDVE